MQLNRIVASAALAVCSASSFAVGGPLDLSTGSTGFFSTPTAGLFSDVYTFTLPSTSVVTGSITAVVGGTQDVDFSSITITGPSGSFAFSMINPDPVEVWALPGAGVTLGAGSYSLTLLGSNSASMGSYGGNLAIAPVPEPQPVALLLAGLGAIGFLTRRRKS